MELSENSRHFKYRARDSKGRLVTGQISAENHKSARSKIVADGLTVVQMSESPYLKWLARAKNFIGESVPTTDLIFFTRQLQIVYSVGIPILKGLDMIHNQTANPILKKVIKGLLEAMAEGSSLHAAMAKFENIFDPIFVNLIRVGETTGDLSGMLKRAALLIEEKAEQKQKVASATFYPKIVMGVIVAVTLVVVYFVLPKMKMFYGGFGAQLPPLTRIVMGVSDFCVNNWYLLSFGPALIWGFKKLLKKPIWRLRYDTLLLKVPVLGALFLEIEVNTFCVILDTLLRSGISIVESLSHVEQSMSNAVVKNDIAYCREQVKGGATLTAGLEPAATFSGLVKGLIAMGEESGKLPDVLVQIANYFKVQIDHKLDNLAKLIEPILLFFIFGFVLVLALAIFLPMWKMNTLLKSK